MAGNASGRMLIDRAADKLYVAIRFSKFKVLINSTVMSDADLKAISVPALFLIGEKERMYPARIFGFFASLTCVLRW